MKRLLATSLLLLALARSGWGQATNYINNGLFNSPPATAPQIDAINFINNGSFNIALESATNLNSSFFNILIFGATLPLFDFSDTLNYTNKGVMTADTGFQFDTAVSGAGSRHAAANFANTSAGSISAGSFTNVFTTNFLFFIGVGPPRIKIWATNIMNQGVLDVGTGGLLSLSGNNLDLSRGTLHIEGLDDVGGIFGPSGFFSGIFLFGISANLGIFDDYWSAGRQTNEFANFALPASPLFLPAQSPFYLATNIFRQQVFGSIALGTNTTISTFANVKVIDGSNITFQVVFLGNTNNAIATDCRFEPFGDFGIPVIQWQSATNIPGVTSSATNSLYLADIFAVTTNLQTITNSFSLSGQPTLAPFNYSFTRSFTNYGKLPVGNTPFTPTVMDGFVNGGMTNDYTAYAVTLAPSTAIPDPTVPGSSITNEAGRIEITASNVLDLTRAHITGPNYALLQSTNHFVGSSKAQIILPNCDINLGTTNGVLNITNLVAPFVPRLVGDIFMWSGRWTNVDATGVTNRYHVLMVDSRMSPTTPALIQNFFIRSTNVFVSDNLQIQQNFLMNAERVTVTTNGPGAVTSSGGINLFQVGIDWPSSMPRLQFLTNAGTISVDNVINFDGVRQPPYFTSSFTEPYQALVNHGSIFSSGDTILADYFENSGTGLITSNATSGSTMNTALVSASSGLINLQSTTAFLTNGAFLAPSGDISISSGALVVGNHALQAGSALSLSATALLTDGDATSSNLWQAGNGFNLLVKPTSGDLLSTTVHSTAPPGTQVFNTWAGEDRGVSPAGFGNNVAIGHLILDGGDADSLFTFTGTGAKNAIYVDLLELQNFATNRISPNFTSLDVDTNMMIYFADARIGNADISEKLDGANGGRFRWVPSYAGLFSSTNITYPSGRTYTFNIALVQSSTLDSDGDGIPNSADPTPIFTADNVAFSVQLTNQPPGTALLSWQSLQNSTNFLYFKSSLAATNWTVVTNFVQGPVNTRVTVADQVRASGPGFYQVRVDAAQP